MALNITKQKYGPDKLLKLQVLMFLIQYALENDVDFVDGEDLHDWILGATDAQIDCVQGMDEYEATDLLVDLNTLLSAAYEEEVEVNPVDEDAT